MPVGQVHICVKRAPFVWAHNAGANNSIWGDAMAAERKYMPARAAHRRLKSGYGRGMAWCPM